MVRGITKTIVSRVKKRAFFITVFIIFSNNSKMSKIFCTFAA